MKCVVRFPQSCNPRRAISVGVDAVFGIRCRRAQQIGRVRRNRRAGGIETIQIGLVYEAGLISQAGIQAHGESFRHGKIQHPADIFVGRMSMGCIADPDLDFGVEGLWIRDVLHEADRATQRAGAVQGPLRSAQNLHVIQVLQPQVDEQRRIVDVCRYRRNHWGCQCQLTCCRLAVQAANDQRRAVDASERSLVRYVDAGYRVRKRRNILDAALFQRGAGNCRDADRKILRRNCPARCRHDDFLQTRFLHSGIVGMRTGAVDSGQDRCRYGGNRDVCCFHWAPSPRAS